MPTVGDRSRTWTAQIGKNQSNFWTYQPISYITKCLVVSQFKGGGKTTPYTALQKTADSLVKNRKLFSFTQQFVVFPTILLN